MNDTDISINNSVVRDASDIQEMTRNTIDLDDKQTLKRQSEEDTLHDKQNEKETVRPYTSQGKYVNEQRVTPGLRPSTSMTGKRVGKSSTLKPYRRPSGWARQFSGVDRELF